MHIYVLEEGGTNHLYCGEGRLCICFLVEIIYIVRGGMKWDHYEYNSYYTG